MENRDPERRQKWRVAGLCWGALTMVSMIRIAMGVAAPVLMETHDISPRVMGYILAGWNWTYVPCQLIMGPVVDRFGSWMVMGLGATAWSLSTIALPLAGATAVSLFSLRALFGIGHSMIIPAQAVSISKWFRSRQRSSALGFSFTGTLVGIAIGTTICAFLLDRLGWQSIFYWVGAANLLYALFWFFFYPDRTLGRQEKLDPEKTEADRVSMVSLLHYRSAWGLALGQFGSLYAYYVFVGWLPSYLVMERGMSILRTGIVGSLPFWMGMIGSIGGGWLGDHLIRRGIYPTVARKAVVATGLMSATLLVIAAAYTPQTWLAVALLSLCMGTLKVTTGSAQSMPIDLAPSTSVASLVSLQNFGGNIGGLLAPIVTGYIFASTGSFSGALLTAGGVMTFGAFSYVFIVGRLPEQSSAP